MAANAQNTTRSGGSRYAPAGYMIGYVFIFSWVPLIIDFGLAGSNPLLFNAGLAIGKVLGVGIWLVIACRQIILDQEVLRLILSRTFSKALLLGSIAHMTYALFAWSTSYVDTAVSTIIYETWPILYIFLLTKLISTADNKSRYRSLSLMDYILCILAFCGLIYVILGTYSSQGAESSNYVPYQVLGIVLAIAAAAVSSLNAYNFRWGTDLRKDLPRRLAPKGEGDLQELACVMIAFALSSLLVLPGSLVIGFAVGGHISVGSSITSIVAGAGLLSLGSICFRRANLETKNPAVNALSYGTPVVALAWLAVFTDINVANLEYIVIGASAIIAMNLLLNVDPEELVDDSYRLGFRALVLSLWAIGAFVYSRDEWFTLGWLHWSSDAYWTILTLSATVFTLILSFRVNRIANRTATEDHQTATILRKLQDLQRQKVIESKDIETFMSMMYTKSADMRAAYKRLRLAIRAAQDVRSNEDLVPLETQLDLLIYSKQRGREFGEIVAIFALATITVGLAILSRPQLSGWSGFLVEMFVMIFCSTIVYLVVNLADLRRERFARVFRSEASSGTSQRNGIDYSIVLHDEDALRLDGIVALIMSVVVVVAFGYVLFVKWLG